MARPQAPCGTYPAYRRHLRKHEPVDAACRRAQQQHDAGRSVAASREPVEPVRIPVRPLSLDEIAETARLEVLAKAREIVAAAETDDGYRAIDATVELDPLLESWCEAQDDVDAAAGWPHLPEDLRARLAASRTD